MNKETAIVLFKEKAIRRKWHNEEWWFAVVDIVAALTGSAQPAGYLKDMRRRDPELSKGWGQIATPLLVETTGGNKKLTAPTLKVFYVLFNPSPPPKPSPSSVGW